MSKSRSSSEDSFVLNLERSSETTDSSFGTSDLSFGSTLSEKADNIRIILGSFIPEKLIPSHEDIEVVISNLTLLDHLF